MPEQLLSCMSCPRSPSLCVVASCAQQHLHRTRDAAYRSRLPRSSVLPLLLGLAIFVVLTTEGFCATAAVAGAPWRLSARRRESTASCSHVPSRLSASYRRRPEPPALPRPLDIALHWIFLSPGCHSSRCWVSSTYLLGKHPRHHATTLSAGCRLLWSDDAVPDLRGDWDGASVIGTVATHGRVGNFFPYFRINFLNLFRR